MPRRASTAALLLVLVGCSRCREEAPVPAPPPPGRPTTGLVQAGAVPVAASASSPAGPRAEAEAWEVTLAPPPTVGPGATAEARVTIAARGTFHVNPDYPLSFRPDPSASARFSGERVALGAGAARTPCAAHPDLPCQVNVPLSFTAPRSGEAHLAGTLAFSVCNDDRCLIEKVALSAATTVR